MKNDEHDDRLLDDLLTGSGADDFRAEMLNRTLGQVRRRKLARQWGRGTLAADTGSQNADRCCAAASLPEHG